MIVTGARYPEFKGVSVEDGDVVCVEGAYGVLREGCMVVSSNLPADPDLVVGRRYVLRACEPRRDFAGTYERADGLEYRFAEVE